MYKKLCLPVAPCSLPWFPRPFSSRHHLPSTLPCPYQRRTPNFPMYMPQWSLRKQDTLPHLLQATLLLFSMRSRAMTKRRQKQRRPTYLSGNSRNNSQSFHHRPKSYQEKPLETPLHLPHVKSRNKQVHPTRIQTPRLGLQSALLIEALYSACSKVQTPSQLLWANRLPPRRCPPLCPLQRWSFQLYLWSTCPRRQYRVRR